MSLTGELQTHPIVLCLIAMDMVFYELGIGLAFEGSYFLVVLLLRIATDILIIYVVGGCYYI